MTRILNRVPAMLESDQFTWIELRKMFLTLLLDQFFIFFIGVLSTAMVSSVGEAAIAAASPEALETLRDESEICARGMIEAGDLLLTLLIKDYACAISYVEACDDNLVSGFRKKFNPELDRSDTLTALQNIMTYRVNDRYTFMTRWIGNLQVDYENEYDRYKYLL